MLAAVVFQLVRRADFIPMELTSLTTGGSSLPSFIFVPDVRHKYNSAPLGSG